MFRKISWWSVPLVIALTISAPANAGIDKIDFKYTSMAHLGFGGSVVTTPQDPKQTLDLVANFLRSNGVTVTKIEEGKTGLTQTEGDRACEAWVHAIYKAEWSAFSRNKFKEYKKIDRSGQPAGCSSPKASWIQYAYSARTMETGVSYTINGLIDRPITFNESGIRPSFSTIFSGYSTANVISMVPTQSSRTANFQTFFFIQIWKDASDDRTSVFALGIPRSDGVEAGPNASIGAFYRPYADARIESAAVGNILSFVTQKAITGK
jgi:hypothetical protein